MICVLFNLIQWGLHFLVLLVNPGIPEPSRFSFLLQNICTCVSFIQLMINYETKKNMVFIGSTEKLFKLILSPFKFNKNCKLFENSFNID